MTLAEVTGVTWMAEENEKEEKEEKKEKKGGKEIEGSTRDPRRPKKRTI